MLISSVFLHLEIDIVKVASETLSASVENSREMEINSLTGDINAQLSKAVCGWRGSPSDLSYTHHPHRGSMWSA